MSDEAAVAQPTAQDAPAQDAPTPTEPAPTPPWGSDEDFNPEKAWKLIENLRAESKDAKSKVKAFEDAQLTAAEKAERDLQELRSNYETAQLTNARLQALVDNPSLKAEDLELIAGSTAEEIQANAAKLAERLGSGIPAAPPTNKPQPVLRGGADPVTNTAEPVDWLRAALSKSKE
ncbi:hypothetical protein [Jonesia denitrificans]|uniref:Scaffolding protein n=1 Tax=Jonesia denitrificans (strain ATCC 14870 / DSM 20603 / BCRC 15368 / CIP 55.134 / JCM 11481 / NBRC 15587 / NCTC 10816 / Prevot 55134) TaxID=471856 RepID=C7R1H0_JONDD|nr:hypothetical protein [Jonesia denitrificans]ACV09805.1 hypothetical protein Jden_2168 [Jonesia denitrificans DSM 20603]ASE08995.1 hypothetical protein CEP80_07495 [Jonesia denitrificans]QXB43541.1 hypothetical protein I6L70_01145 [Jonesia denitrificans]SQH22443.1 Uncharacterised protein [Jonesia denitrificans]